MSNTTFADRAGTATGGVGAGCLCVPRPRTQPTNRSRSSSVLDGVRVLPLEDRDDFTKTRIELDGVLDAIAMGGGTLDAGAQPIPAAPATDAGPEDTVLDEAP